MQKLRFPFVLARRNPQAKGLLFWGPGGTGSGNLFDLSGNFDNADVMIGTVPATGRWVEGVDGGGKSALRYDGGTNRTRLVRSTDVLSGASAMSLSCWVKTSNVANYNYLIVKWGEAAGTDSFHLRLEITTGTVYFSHSTDGSYQAGNDVLGTSNCADGKWHMIVVTYDGAATNIYVDGKLETTAARSGAIFATALDVSLGGLSDGGATANWLLGDQDDPRIYNYALPATLVKEMYNPATRWSLRFRPNLAARTFTTPFVPPPPPPPPPPPWVLSGLPRDADDGWPDDAFTEDFDPRFASVATFSPAVELPDVDPADARPVKPYSIDYDPDIKSSRSRRHERKVSLLLNRLGELGFIQGTLEEPYLGYFPASPQSWGPTRPTSVAEALDILIELLS
jgi:hypothetical protein